MFKELKEELRRLEDEVENKDWELGAKLKDAHEDAFMKSKIEGMVYGAVGTLSVVAIGFGIKQLIKK